MPNLDPIHDHAGSAAISSEGHIPGAADPSYTIDEDDRIGALIEAVEAMRREHAEFTKAVSSAAGIVISEVTDIIASAVKQFTEAMSPLISTVNELADGAGLAPVDAPDDRNCAQKMADGDFGEAVFSMYKIIRDNIGGEWSTEVSAGKATVRSVLALCTMYRSGKATTGGSDHNLRDDLRAILRAEGFDVRC